MATSEAPVQLSEETLRHIHEVVERLRKKHREEFGEIPAKATEEQVRQTLAALDELAKHLPTRPQHEVEEELRQIRENRRSNS